MAKSYGRTPHQAQTFFMANGQALGTQKLTVYLKYFSVVVMAGSIALTHVEMVTVVQNFFGSLIATLKSPNTHSVDVPTETVSSERQFFTKVLFI